MRDMSSAEVNLRVSQRKTKSISICQLESTCCFLYSPSEPDSPTVCICVGLGAFQGAGGLCGLRPVKAFREPW